MSGFIGADPDELRNLAKQMASSAERLDEVRTELVNYYQRVRWAGDDAQRAKGEFRTVHARKMRQVTSMLRETADLVRSQAQEQTDTSSNGTGFPDGLAIAQPLPDFRTLPDETGGFVRPAEDASLQPDGEIFPEWAPAGEHSDLWETPEAADRPHVYEAYTEPESQ